MKYGRVLVFVILGILLNLNAQALKKETSDDDQKLLLGYEIAILQDHHIGSNQILKTIDTLTEKAVELRANTINDDYGKLVQKMNKIKLEYLKEAKSYIKASVVGYAVFLSKQMSLAELKSLKQALLKFNKKLASLETSVVSEKVSVYFQEVYPKLSKTRKAMLEEAFGLTGYSGVFSKSWLLILKLKSITNEGPVVLDKAQMKAQWLIGKESRIFTYRVWSNQDLSEFIQLLKTPIMRKSVQLYLAFLEKETNAIVEIGKPYYAKIQNALYAYYQKDRDDSKAISVQHSNITYNTMFFELVVQKGLILDDVMVKKHFCAMPKWKNEIYALERVDAVFKNQEGELIMETTIHREDCV